LSIVSYNKTRDCLQEFIICSIESKHQSVSKVSSCSDLSMWTHCSKREAGNTIVNRVKRAWNIC